MSELGTWVGPDAFLARDSAQTIMTIFPDGSIELRGDGWKMPNTRRQSRNNPNFDHFRRVRPGNTVEEARKFCEILAKTLIEHDQLRAAQARKGWAGLVKS